MTIVEQVTLSQEDRELISSLVDKVGHTTLMQEVVDQWLYWLNSKLVGGLDDEIKQKLAYRLVGMLDGNEGNNW